MTPLDKSTRPVRRGVQLLAGLALYGLGMALMVRSGLGLTAWDVFHQGVSRHTGLSLGAVVVLVAVPVMLLWIPLRQRPGVGTVANAALVGVAADASLAVLPEPGPLWLRAAALAAGILAVGLATGLYLGAGLGPGPRDGLMTGLAGRLPRLSLRAVRTGVELTVLGTGALLGGTVGVGTVAFALAIGPLAQLFLRLCTVRPAPAGG